MLPFRSFWMGGFEGADHINGLQQPLDMVRSTGHLDQLDADFERAAALGLHTVRESIGWRLAEPEPGRFDLTRARRIAGAARRHRMQVLWTLMHYGTPGDVSMLGDALIDRFARFAAAVAEAIGPLSDMPPIYNPVNEIGFVSWAVSQTNLVHPYRGDPRDAGPDTAASGYAVKRRLVQASLAAIEAMRRIDPRARFMHVEPVVHVAAPVGRPDLEGLARQIDGYQWQAWDMIAGRIEPALGGHAGALDLIGVNHYHTSQWEVATEQRLSWHGRDPRRRPLSALLRTAWERYRRPLIVAETSHIGRGRAAWLNDVASEVERARAGGVPVDGICLYPLIDRTDWNDSSHWHRSGLWDVVPAAENAPPGRALCHEYAAALGRWQGYHISAVQQKGVTMPCLIVFSHLRWEFVYQRPQHLLSRLARHYRIFFVEEPVKSDGPPRLDRVSQGPGIDVLVPRTPVDAFGFHDDQLPVLKPLLADFLREQAIDDYLVWFYTPMALPLISELHPRAVVYDCMDELSAFHGAPRQLKQRETALMRQADLVLTGGPALYESKRHLHANVHCLPSSVDVAHYAPAGLQWQSAEAEAAQRLQGALPGPRLGFFGVIDERFDTALLAALAAARPDWQIVMVGPVVKIDPAQLPRYPNLHWLGMQPYARLPYLMAGWDVCLMPFALNDATRFISPTKTLEYLAGEKPVVSTAVGDVIALYGDAVRIATGAAAFIAACDAALAETVEQRVAWAAKVVGTVLRSSWDGCADRVGELLVDALAKHAATVPGAVDAPALAAGDAPPAAAVHRTPRHVRHLIVGAGATGLSTAFHLRSPAAPADTLLIERADTVGGGCRSLQDGGFIFDHAGQGIAATDPEVLALCVRLLGDNLHWPSGATPRFGYPLKGGFQALTDGFLPLLNCELALKTSVLHVSPKRRTVRLDDGRSLTFDALVSTMPLPLLVQACGDEAPPVVRAAALALRHVSLRCVNLGIGLAPGQTRLTDQHAIDFAGEATVFDRIFVQGNASPHNQPPGGFGLTCEIVYSAADPLPCEGDALIDRVVADCRRVGLIAAGQAVLVANQVDVPCAYVVHDAARAAHVALIREWLAPYGVVLAGRYSEWNDDDAHHAFVAGRKAAEAVRLGLARAPLAQAG